MNLPLAIVWSSVFRRSHDGRPPKGGTPNPRGAMPVFHWLLTAEF
jgi:hypothetical protein